MTFEELLALSAFPLVNLAAPSPPSDGFLVDAPTECRKNFGLDRRCQNHYESLRNKSGVAVQCPFGFASFAVRGFDVAFSGIIPFPRLGGELERKRAKLYGENKISVAAVERAAAGFSIAAQRIAAAEIDVVKKQSFALHEIRKLNRNVKQTAERLCLQQSPQDIDKAAPELVRILKTSELMSHQFDVLELLANEGLASLPLNTLSDVYRMFDKCVRIYQPESAKDRISIWEPAGFTPIVRVCDKTFPIIPTVLIENAIKHAIPGSRITVELRPEGAENCVVSVSNLASGQNELSPGIFDRGVRGTSEVEGSGHGLYLAQLIARQHNTVIQLRTESVSNNRLRVTFILVLKLAR